MPSGTVKWFNMEKGFGFIVPDEGGSDIFLPLKSVEHAKLPKLDTGVALSFTVAEVKGRKFAQNLVVLAPMNNIRRSGTGARSAIDPDPVTDFEKEWGLRRD